MSRNGKIHPGRADIHRGNSDTQTIYPTNNCAITTGERGTRSLTVYDSGPHQVAEEVMSPLGCED